VTEYTLLLLDRMGVVREVASVTGPDHAEATAQARCRLRQTPSMSGFELWLRGERIAAETLAVLAAQIPA
jgi:hypothetical protein